MGATPFKTPVTGVRFRCDLKEALADQNAPGARSVHGAGQERLVWQSAGYRRRSEVQQPNLTLFIIQIAGAVALLIWSVRLVRTGVERAFVMQLRLWLRRSARSRLLAAATGLASAMLLQSSTAVAILVTGFVSGGSVAGAVGLAILLGADVGSALVAKVLLVRTAWLEPLLLLVGVALFLRSPQQRWRQTGRILIGLALIFLSLDMIGNATAPLVDSAGAASVMQYLGRDVVTAFLIGAVFAWVVHSSVAAVLLFVTLVAQGLLPQSAAVAMVLGANLGGTMIAYLLTYSDPVEARRMIVSNLVLRGGGPDWH
jgi:phosphate:Na+ symporter